MRVNRFAIGFLILFLSLLSSCAGVTIHDSEWCGDIGSYGASCFHTVTDQRRDLSKEKWDNLRYGQLCTSAESFANWKASLLKLCGKTGMCSFEEKKLISEMGERIDSFNYKAYYKRLHR